MIAKLAQVNGFLKKERRREGTLFAMVRLRL